MNMNYPDTVARMEQIHSRLEQLDGKHRVSRADEQEFTELRAEFDELDNYRQRLERKEQLAQAGGDWHPYSDGSGGRRLRREPGSVQPSRHDYDSDERGGLRDQAMRQLDVSVRNNDLPESGAEVVERLLATGPDTERSWVARWVTATGHAAYRSAFAKLLLHGEQSAPTHFTPEEREAFDRVAKVKMEQRAMSLTDSAGGYLTPFELDPIVLLTSDGSANPLMSISRVITTTADVWHGVSSDGVTAEWLAEAAEAADASLTLAQPSIPAHKMSVFVPFSVELEGDAANLLTELGRLLQDSASQKLNEALTTGDGSGKPTGIITALAGGSSEVASATTDVLAASDVFALQNALPPRFSGNAQWCANLATINAIRQFESANGAVRFPELAGGQLLGRNVNELSNMDGVIDATQENHVLLYGDFSNYVVTQRVGSSVELVSHLVGANRRPTGQRGLWLWARYGGDVVVDNAFRVLNVT